MKLQILVPQYNETEKVISKLLDSIQIQQGVNMAEDFGVIIVNDGSSTFLSKNFLSKYDFPIEYHKDEHRGIAGTRNALLGYAKADYIMFCDADDMFGSMVAIYSILRSIRESDFDELISYFYNETHLANGYLVFNENTRLITPFIHGKVYRRNYLLDNNIKFNETIKYHEDVYFSFLAHSCAGVVKLLQQYAYIWKFNTESITHSNNFSIKNYTDSLKSIELVCDELIARGKEEDARFYYTCCLFNSYFFMHQPSWLAQTETFYWDRICIGLQRIWAKYGEKLFESADEAWRNGVWEETAKGSVPNEEDRQKLEPFKDWLNNILAGEYENDDEE